MSDSEKKGLELMEQAEKKLKEAKGFWSFVFGCRWYKTNKAIKCYKRAAIMFKIAKKWGNAGEAFAKAADLHVKNQRRYSAAINFVDSAKCYKKTDIKIKVFIFYLEKAIEQFEQVGEFRDAARYHTSIGEALDGIGDLEKAIHHYEQAADYYEIEMSDEAAKEAMLKVAALAAEMCNYTKAIKVYEKVAASTWKKGWLKYTAHNYFFKAAVCHLCVNVLNCQQALERYGDMYSGFRDSWEYKLMKNLSCYVQDKDVAAFTRTLKANGRLENWFTTLFSRVKKTMNAEGKLR